MGKNKKQGIAAQSQRTLSQGLSKRTNWPLVLGLGLTFILWDWLTNSSRIAVAADVPVIPKKQKIEDEQIAAETEGERALPHRLQKPTYWPFFLALGLTFIFWGLLTTWVILLAGFLVFIISLWGWINILRHE